ncbi:MAG: hypothetical protein ACP5KN_13270 [Armatimonadota bacterium]
MVIFDLDRRLLRAAETLNPADPRLKAAREALDRAAKADPGG